MNLNKAIDTVLAKGHLLLVYPEQAMWWNYKKPRKYRIGAYRWASRNNVPVIPCFTTMEDMDEFEDNGLKKQKLTYHIGEPIYPDANLDAKQNAQMMMDKNKEFTVSVYEKTYNIKYEIN
jgi:1-acyl-sn-glycerol-3-phosphate acyltransferase